VITVCVIGEPEPFASVPDLREHVRDHRGGRPLPIGWGREALEVEHSRYPHGQPTRWTNAAGQPLDLARLPTPAELDGWLAHWTRPGHPGEVTVVDATLDDGLVTAAMLADPRFATGRCHDTSQVLSADLAAAIPDCEPNDDGEWVGYGCVQAGEHPDRRRRIREHHVVVVATSQGPHVLDLTARQFDAALPFPLIQPAAAYMRWGQWWTNALNFPPDPRSPSDPPDGPGHRGHRAHGVPGAAGGPAASGQGRPRPTVGG
jgi:hypothetical protein